MYTYNDNSEIPLNEVNKLTISPRRESGDRPLRPTKECRYCQRGSREYFSEYCNNTSLHGLKYVGGERRTVFEKVLWCLLFSIAVSCCCLLISKTYKKWMTTPVIVTFSEMPNPIWEVPFPTITICPQNPCKQTEANYTELYSKALNNKLNKRSKRIFEKLSLICDERILVDEEIKFEDDDVLDLFEQVAPTLEDSFFLCEWKGVSVNCSDVLKKHLTKDGICYTFNNLASNEIYTEEMYIPEGFVLENETKSKDWTPEGGYETIDTTNSYPKRTLLAGQNTGLTMILKVEEEDLDYICKSPTQGFKIIIYAPGEATRGTLNYVIVPIDNEVSIAITPNQITTSEELKSYKPEDRRCYFQNEKKLKFFQKYSYANCYMECIANYTLLECGCVEFYMPRDNSTIICGGGNENCVDSVEVNILTGKYSKEETKSKKLAPCGCMPSCHSTQYNAESSQAFFNWQRLYKSLGKLQNMIKSHGMSESSHLSVVSIFFKDIEFLPVQKGELYGATDFLANCGGIFGLFTGFSLLSLMEIIYYLTARMWINKCRYGRLCIATPE